MKKKTKKVEYRLIAKYKGYDPAFDIRLEKIIGRGGIGEGYTNYAPWARLEWTFKTELSRNTAADKLRKIKEKDLIVSVDRTTEILDPPKNKNLINKYIMLRKKVDDNFKLIDNYYDKVDKLEQNTIVILNKIDNIVLKMSEEEIAEINKTTLKKVAEIDKILKMYK